jgi:hypothetical protein
MVGGGKRKTPPTSAPSKQAASKPPLPEFKLDAPTEAQKEEFEVQQGTLEGAVEDTIKGTPQITKAKAALKQTNRRLWTLLVALEKVVPAEGIRGLVRKRQKPGRKRAMTGSGFNYDREPPDEDDLWLQAAGDNTVGKKSLLYWLRDHVFVGDLTNYEKKGQYRSGFQMLSSLAVHAIELPLAPVLIVPLVGRAYALLRQSYTLEASNSGNKAAMTGLQNRVRLAAKRAYGNTKAYELIEAITVATAATTKSRSERSGAVKEGKQRNQKQIPYETLLAIRQTLFDLGKDGEHPWERFVFIMLATGSRPIEVAMIGKFTGLEGDMFRVEGLAKKRGDKQESREAPLLRDKSDPDHLATADLGAYVTETRKQLNLKYSPKADEQQRSQQTNKLHTQWRKIIRTHFGKWDLADLEDADAPALRALYANEAFELAKQANPGLNMSRNAYIANVLGHANLNSAPSYQGWNITREVDNNTPSSKIAEQITNTSAAIAELRQAAKQVRAELAEMKKNADMDPRHVRIQGDYFMRKRKRSGNKDKEADKAIGELYAKLGTWPSTRMLKSLGFGSETVQNALARAGGRRAPKRHKLPPLPPLDDLPPLPP